MALSSEFGSSSSISHRATHKGMAFLVEALVVLAILMVSLAVFVRLFTSAQLEAVHAKNLSQAVVIATNRAEEFAADPTQVESSTEEGEFTVLCDVKPNPSKDGTLYDATIEVRKDGETLYTLQTSRYLDDDAGSDA